MRGLRLSTIELGARRKIFRLDIRPGRAKKYALSRPRFLQQQSQLLASPTFSCSQFLLRSHRHLYGLDHRKMAPGHIWIEYPVSLVSDLLGHDGRPDPCLLSLNFHIYVSDNEESLPRPSSIPRVVNIHRPSIEEGQRIISLEVNSPS